MRGLIAVAAVVVCGIAASASPAFAAGRGPGGSVVYGNATYGDPNGGSFNAFTVSVFAISYGDWLTYGSVQFSYAFGLRETVDVTCIRTVGDVTLVGGRVVSTPFPHAPGSLMLVIHDNGRTGDTWDEVLGPSSLNPFRPPVDTCPDAPEGSLPGTFTVVPL